MDVKIIKETARKKNLPLEIHVEPLEHLPPPKGARQVRDGDEQDARGGRKNKKWSPEFTNRYNLN